MPVPVLIALLVILAALALGWWIVALRREASAAREQLALALDASRLALGDYDVTSGRVYLSETWSTMLGAAPAPTSTTIQDLAALVPQEEQATVGGAIVAALKGPESFYRVEHQVMTPAGTRIWIVSEGRVVARSADGRAVRMIGTNRDITDRVLAAEALRKSESQFRGAMEHSAIGMAILSLEGRWQMVNPALCALTGYSEAELLSRTFHEITHPEDRAISPERLQELLTGKLDIYQVDKRYVHKRGHEIWVQVNVSLVRDADGQPLHLISQILDVSERHAMLERIEHLALHDPLTGLPNSRLLLDRLEQMLAAARRAKRPLGVMYMDLDGFKPVNDAHGHAAGDAVLKEVAARLVQVLREIDSVARIGGDEFVALLGDVSGEADAAAAAERVIAALIPPFETSTTQAQLSASIGIALYPAHGEDAQSLLQRADTAMYQAKRAGKCTYRFFAEAPKQV